MATAPSADAFLVRRLRARDRTAWEELYGAYGSRLRAFAYRLAGNAHDADDLVQETFVRALPRLDRLDPDTVQLGPYFFTTLRNVFLKRVERERRLTPVEDVPEPDEPAPIEDDPERSTLLTAQQEEVRVANARLAPRQRLVLALRELEDRSYAEIGGIVGLKENAVAQLISRARESLRTELRLAQVDPAALPEACRRFLPLLSRHLDGQLRGAELELTLGHLEGCERCQEALLSMREAQRRYRSLVPLGAEEAHAASIDAELTAGGYWNGPVRRLAWLGARTAVLAVVAAALVVAGAAGIGAAVLVSDEAAAPGGPSTGGRASVAVAAPAAETSEAPPAAATTVTPPGTIMPAATSGAAVTRPRSGRATPTAERKTSTAGTTTAPSRSTPATRTSGAVPPAPAAENVPATTPEPKPKPTPEPKPKANPKPEPSTPPAPPPTTTPGAAVPPAGTAPPPPPPTDTTAPVVTITARPPATTSVPEASFAFGANEADVTFTCRLDEAAAAACTSPITYRSLAPGTHTFAVQARDRAGNLGPEATARWTYVLPDKTPPTVTLASTVSGPDVTFTFTASEPDVTFACSLDAGPFGACTSPAVYRGLAPGTHSFAVRATDRAGNTGPSATHTWTVASPLPDLVVTQLSGTSFTVTNAGAVAAGAFAVSVTLVGTYTFAGLAPGQSATRTWSPCRKGTLRAVADFSNLVPESDEGNNTRTFSSLC